MPHRTKTLAQMKATLASMPNGPRKYIIETTGRHPSSSSVHNICQEVRGFLAWARTKLMEGKMVDLPFIGTIYGKYRGPRKGIKGQEAGRFILKLKAEKTLTPYMIKLAQTSLATAFRSSNPSFYPFRGQTKNDPYYQGREKVHRTQPHPDGHPPGYFENYRLSGIDGNTPVPEGQPNPDAAPTVPAAPATPTATVPPSQS